MKEIFADKIPVHCSFTQIIPIKDLKPHPRNPNTHPDQQIILLAKIIKTQGWRNPIVVSKRSGFIIKGHARLLAAKLLQVSEVPVDEQLYLSENNENTDLLADNRIAALAEMDITGLTDLLKELNTNAFDMDLTGFDSMALERLIIQSNIKNEISNEIPNKVDEVYSGMPACENKDQLNINLIIHFQSYQEKINFGKLINQNITQDTKSTWYPKQFFDSHGTQEGLKYVES